VFGSAKDMGSITKKQQPQCLSRKKEALDASVSETPRLNYPYIGYDQYNALEHT
jgi:hypothetical protein